MIYPRESDIIKLFKWSIIIIQQKKYCEPRIAYNKYEISPVNFNDKVSATRTADHDKETTVSQQGRNAFHLTDRRSTNKLPIVNLFARHRRTIKNPIMH